MDCFSQNARAAARSRPGRAVWGVLVVSGILLGASWAEAQPAADVAPAARALFDEGRALMTKKDYAGACTKFEESQRIDAGGGTLLNLALCNEFLGRTATAYAHFTEALALAHHDNRADRADFATKHIASLAPRLAYLRVVIPDDARVTGLRVMVNGTPIDESAMGERMPVDPGDQIVEADAPRKRGARFTATVKVDGEERTIQLEPLRDEPVAPLAADLNSGKKDITQRVAGGVMGGLGLASVGLGAFFGLKTLQLKKSADNECPDALHCQPSGIDDNRSATKTATAATWLVAGGTLLTGVGLYFFATAPAQRKSQATVSVTADGLAVRLSGRF